MLKSFGIDSNYYISPCMLKNIKGMENNKINKYYINKCKIITNSTIL